MDSGFDNISASEALRIDQICDQFESAWLLGKRPRIEDHLQTAELPNQLALVRELVALEIECRRRCGEQPTPTEYVERFPPLQPVWLSHVLSLPVTSAVDANPPLASTMAIRLEVTAGPNRGKSFSFTCHDIFIVGRGSTAHLKLP